MLPENPMKILFISEYYPPQTKGGAEINLSILAKALVKSKHTVSILTAGFSDLPAYEEQEEVKIYRRLKTGENPSSPYSNIVRRLLFPFSVKKETERLVSEIDPDVIHFIGTSIIAAPRLRYLNKPLFATIESYPALCPKGDRWYHGKEECKIRCNLKEFFSCQQDSDEIGKMKNKWYLKYNLFFLAYTYHYYKKLNLALASCTLISISRYMQQLLLQHNYQSTVIPNILDVNQFSPVEKKINAEKKDKKVKILYLGSLLRSKGPQILLEALKGVDCRCDLYGEGNLKPELQEYIKKNNLDAEIHPFIPYEKIPGLYAQTDLVVFPSIWPEPFGRIAMEALAAGKIVIASDIGAIRETVEKMGILVKPGNSEELRQSILTVIKNKQKIAEGTLSLHQGRPENIIIKLIKVYQS